MSRKKPNLRLKRRTESSSSFGAPSTTPSLAARPLASPHEPAGSSDGASTSTTAGESPRPDDPSRHVLMLRLLLGTSPQMSPFPESKLTKTLSAPETKTAPPVNVLTDDDDDEMKWTPLPAPDIESLLRSFPPSPLFLEQLCAPLQEEEEEERDREGERRDMMEGGIKTEVNADRKAKVDSERRREDERGKGEFGVKDNEKNNTEHKASTDDAHSESRLSKNITVSSGNKYLNVSSTDKHHPSVPRTNPPLPHLPSKLPPQPPSNSVHQIMQHNDNARRKTSPEKRSDFSLSLNTNSGSVVKCRNTSLNRDPVLNSTLEIAAVDEKTFNVKHKSKNQSSDCFESSCNVIDLTLAQPRNLWGTNRSPRATELVKSSRNNNVSSDGSAKIKENKTPASRSSTLSENMEEDFDVLCMGVDIDAIEVFSDDEEEEDLPQFRLESDRTQTSKVSPGQSGHSTANPGGVMQSSLYHTHPDSHSASKGKAAIGRGVQTSLSGTCLSPRPDPSSSSSSFSTAPFSSSTTSAATGFIRHPELKDNSSKPINYNSELSHSKTNFQYPKPPQHHQPPNSKPPITSVGLDNSRRKRPCSSEVGIKAKSTRSHTELNSVSRSHTELTGTSRAVGTTSVRLSGGYMGSVERVGGVVGRLEKVDRGNKTDRDTSGVSIPSKEPCPMCGTIFPSWYTQVDTDSHIAQCLQAVMDLETTDEDF